MKDGRRVSVLTRTRAKIPPIISKTCFIGGYFAASLFRVSILSSRSDAWASSVRVTILQGGTSAWDARADGASRRPRGLEDMCMPALTMSEGRGNNIARSVHRQRKERKYRLHQLAQSSVEGKQQRWEPNWTGFALDMNAMCPSCPR